jgi:hypothetical protein
MENKDDNGVDDLASEFNRKLQIAFEQLEEEKGMVLYLILDFVTHRLEIKNTEKPNLYASNPFRVHLIKGKDYYYCTCGFSKLQVGLIITL